MARSVGDAMSLALLAAFGALTFDAGPATEGVLIADHRAPLVELRVQFPVGMASLWGIEHELDRAFQTAPLDRDGEFERRIDRLTDGVSLWVDLYAAHASVSCHRADLERCVELLRELLDNEHVDRGRVRQLRRRTRLERSLAAQGPALQLDRAMAELLFAPRDPRRRAGAAAWRETDPRKLAATRRQAIRLPGRRIGFAGDVTAEQALRLARRLLPPVATPTSIATESNFLPLSQPLPKAHDVPMRRLTQTFYRYARPSLSITDPDFPLLMVASEILGGHFYSRLYVALRHEGGDSYTASAQLSYAPETQYYSVTTFTRLENREQIEQRLRRALATFHQAGVTAAEREEALQALAGEQRFARQSPGQLLTRLFWERARGLPDGTVDRLVPLAASRSLAELNRFIRQWFDPTHFTMIRTTSR